MIKKFIHLGFLFLVLAPQINQMIQIFQEDMLDGQFIDNQRILCSILRINTERIWVLKRNYQDKKYQ